MNNACLYMADFHGNAQFTTFNPELYCCPLCAFCCQNSKLNGSILVFISVNFLSLSRHVVPHATLELRCIGMEFND